MVRTSRRYHEYIWRRGGGGGGGEGGDARDNILSTFGSVHYFRGYHKYTGGFHRTLRIIITMW